MKSFVLVWLCLIAVSPTFAQPIASKVYQWDKASVTKQSHSEFRTLFAGTAKGFSNLTLEGTVVLANHPPEPAQQLDEEAILVVKEGELTLTLGEKRKVLGPGSLALVMPGDFFLIENKSSRPLAYYFLRLTSNEVPDLDLYRLAGGSFWIDGPDVSKVIAHQSGTQRLYEGATIMSKRLTVSLATQTPGSSNDTAQPHSANRLLVALDNPVQLTISGNQQAGTGDVAFVNANVAHKISNTGQSLCTYLLVQFE